MLSAMLLQDQKAKDKALLSAYCWDCHRPIFSFPPGISNPLSQCHNCDHWKLSFHFNVASIFK